MKLILVGDVVLNLDAVAAIRFDTHDSTVYFAARSTSLDFYGDRHELLRDTVRQLVADRVISVPVPVPVPQERKAS